MSSNPEQSFRRCGQSDHFTPLLHSGQGFSDSFNPDTFPGRPAQARLNGPADLRGLGTDIKNILYL
jgi:hypothetical protein